LAGEIVWVFGQGRVGKNTMIKRITGNNKQWQFLKDRIGLNDPVIASTESLKTGNKRDVYALKEELIDLANKGYTVLAKNQWHDKISKHLLEEIATQFPYLKQRAIILYSSPFTVIRHYRDRPEPGLQIPDEQTVKALFYETMLYVPDLHKLHLEVLWVDVNNDEYMVLSDGEIRKVEAELLTAQLNTIRAIRDSVSFRLGNILVKAIYKPGKNTVLLPYRMVTLVISEIKRRKRAH
jgi:hypothetical protein